MFFALAVRFVFSFIVALLIVGFINIIFMAGAYSFFVPGVALVAAIVYTKATWEPEFDDDEDY